MENASKALIIAGAILISIVLIAVGVAVVTGAQGAIDEAGGQMSSNEKRIFNEQFQSYQGTKRGSAVKSLLSTVITSNARADEEGSAKIKVGYIGKDNSTVPDGYSKFDDDTTYAQLGGTDSVNGINSISTAISNSGSYTVSMHLNANGIIDGICIELRQQ